MNICYLISNHYKGLGGSEKYSIYLAKEAQNAGHKILFVVGQESELTTALKKEKLEYQIVPMKSSFNPFSLIPAVLRLKRIIKEESIQIIHTNQLREHSIALFAKMFGAKIVVVRTFHRLGQFNLKMKGIMWFLNALTDAFVAVSVTMATNMAQKGITKSKIKTIYNGNPDYKVAKHENKLGFLGRLSSEKGILKFVKENEELFRDHELVIAGEGPEKTGLEKLKSEGLQLEILGTVTDPKDFFLKISVLVLPTSTESTIPLAVTEAMSASIPSVMFNVPVVTAEKVPGLIAVEAGDYKKLAATALELLKDENILKREQVLTRKTYESRFSVGRLWKDTEALYNSLLN